MARRFLTSSLVSNAQLSHSSFDLLVDLKIEVLVQFTQSFLATIDL